MNRKTRLLLSVGMVIGVVLAAVGGAAANPKALPGYDVGGQSAAPLISYQGQVVVNGSPYSGIGYFKFAIVNAGATYTYWNNDGQAPGSGVISPTTSVSLTVTNGLFTVLLGDTSVMHGSLSIAVFNDTADRALRVWFSPDNATFYQLTPDRRITWAPFALVAQQAWNADTIDGLHAADLLNLGVSASNITTGTVSTDRYSAVADLAAEKLLDNKAGNLAQNDGALQPSLNADLLDGLHAADLLTRVSASDITTGTLSTDRYSAVTDLAAEELLDNKAGNLAQNDGALQPSLNADLLDGLHAEALRPVVATAAYETPGSPTFNSLDPGCHAYFVGAASAAAITITVPGPGTIIVEANTNVALSDGFRLTLAISDSPNDCGSDADAYPTRWQTMPDYFYPVYPLSLSFQVRRTFSVTAAGEYMYYLVGQATIYGSSYSGTTSSWVSADMLAQYYP